MEKDLIKFIESYPLATREQILSITLRNLHETAKRNGAVDWEEIEYYLQSVAKDFAHALPPNEKS